MTVQADKIDSTALVALLSIAGIGNARAFELVELFGTPQNVFASDAHTLSEAVKISPAIAHAIIERGRSLEEAEQLLQRTEQLGARVVTYWSREYPQRLRRIDDPPLLLYVKGETSPLYDYAVALVGTRTVSDHSKMITRRIAGELTAAGVTVVSGMAEGVDSLAHEGALVAGGRTIAVLGSGLDVIYPPSNKKLYERIVRQGAVITEYPLETPPYKHHFPHRNRIISGMSIGVVIVEAGMKSGALITARTAIEQQRPLFAVPGAAGLQRSAGVNLLIKDGTAKMVESGQEIIEHLRSQLAPVLNVAATLSLPKLDGTEGKVYDLLENGPQLIDDIIHHTGLSALQVNRILTSMQLKGIVQRLSGSRIGRR